MTISVFPPEYKESQQPPEKKNDKEWTYKDDQNPKNLQHQPPITTHARIIL